MELARAWACNFCDSLVAEIQIWTVKTEVKWKDGRESVILLKICDQCHRYASDVEIGRKVTEYVRRQCE